MAGVGHESLSILFRFARNLLSVLDPDSTVAEPHVSVFQLPTKAKLFAFSVSANKNRPRKAWADFCHCVHNRENAKPAKRLPG